MDRDCDGKNLLSSCIINNKNNIALSSFVVGTAPQSGGNVIVQAADHAENIKRHEFGVRKALSPQHKTVTSMTFSQNAPPSARC